MADDERGEKRSLRAAWRERRTERAAHRAERAVQKAERRARLVAARDIGDGQARTNTGKTVR